jgi:hypothetical protein
MTIGGINRSSASAAGHRVKEGAHLLLSFYDHATHRPLIGFRFGNLLARLGHQSGQSALDGL